MFPCKDSTLNNSLGNAIFPSQRLVTTSVSLRTQTGLHCLMRTIRCSGRPLRPMHAPPRHVCPPMNRMTDACENMIFPQLLLQTVTINLLVSGTERDRVLLYLGHYQRKKEQEDKWRFVEHDTCCYTDRITGTNYCPHDLHIILVLFYNIRVFP